MGGFDIQAPVQDNTVTPQTDNSQAPKEMHLTGSDRTAYKYNPDYHKMSDFLGLSVEDRQDMDTAQKVGFIRDFTGEKDEVDAMLKVKEMMKQLGVNTKGKELIKTLYQYARLSKERQQIDKEISLITNDVSTTHG